jgi:hypothetical protein
MSPFKSPLTGLRFRQRGPLCPIAPGAHINCVASHPSSDVYAETTRCEEIALVRQCRASLRFACDLWRAHECDPKSPDTHTTDFGQWHVLGPPESGSA